MGKRKSVMGVHKHSMLKHCLQVCTRPLMGMREVELEFVAMLNLARKERRDYFFSANEAESAQKSFLLSKLPKYLK